MVSSSAMGDSRRQFIKTGLFAMMAWPVAAFGEEANKFPFSRDYLRERIAAHEEDLEQILRQSFQKFDSAPEPSERELSYDEGLARTAEIAAEVSKVLNRKIERQGIHDLRVLKDMIAKSGLFPPDMPASVFVPLIDGTANLMLEKAGFAKGSGISMGIGYWGEDNFDNVYSHELVHHAVAENSTKEKLRDAMKRTRAYKIAKAEQKGDDSQLNYEVGGVIECLNEGLARVVQEEVAQSRALATGKPGIVKKYYNYLLTEITSAYIYARKAKNLEIPSWVEERVEKNADLTPTDVELSDSHALGTAALKLMQLKFGEGVARQIFYGYTGTFERFLGI